jgi:hypothetical protein
MPTRPSGSSNRYDPTTSMESAADGPHDRLGAHSAMTSALVGVTVARWKIAMAGTVGRASRRWPHGFLGGGRRLDAVLVGVTEEARFDRHGSGRCRGDGRRGRYWLSGGNCGQVRSSERSGKASSHSVLREVAPGDLAGVSHPGVGIGLEADHRPIVVGDDDGVSVVAISRHSTHAGGAGLHDPCGNARYRVPHGELAVGGLAHHGSLVA